MEREIDGEMERESHRWRDGESGGEMERVMERWRE